MSKIQALILDAGGVMVHPIHGDWNIPARYSEYLGEYADRINTPEYASACYEEREFLNEDRYLPNVSDEYTCRYEFLKAIFKRLGWTLADDRVEALAQDFTYNPDRYAWYPDTDEVLEQLHKKYRIGVLSDSMPSFRLVSDQHDAQLKHFDAVSISCEVGCTKPNPRMYNDILEKLNIPAENCLFVDDRPCNLEGARALGIQAVQMCRDGLKEWDGPAVHTLVELKEYLENLQ